MTTKGRTGGRGAGGDQSLPGRASAELEGNPRGDDLCVAGSLTPKAIYKLLESEPKEDIQAALADVETGLRGGRAASSSSRWPVVPVGDAS